MKRWGRQDADDGRLALPLDLLNRILCGGRAFHLTLFAHFTAVSRVKQDLYLSNRSFQSQIQTRFRPSDLALYNARSACFNNSLIDK